MENYKQSLHLKTNITNSRMSFSPFSFLCEESIEEEECRDPAISIVMPAYNAEEFINEAIDSIVNQSFTNFECIIVDDGSTDATREIVRSYDDKHIVLLENKHNFIDSLNMGMNAASGKYIARMDADDVMHPDRLLIQYTIMETEPSITVCSTWMKRFGDNISVGNMANSLSGWIEYPLLAFLKGNFVFHPTAMIRKFFLIENKLNYQESYLYAEDLKLWMEIAKNGGGFYVENQPLLYYRISESQVTRRYKEEQKTTAENVMHEILLSLIIQNANKYPELKSTFYELLKLQENKLITFSALLDFFQNLFINNKNKLYLA
ncbi:MAG: glycosyltransferase family 2 protein [Fermentimonas sp.]|nr:glycosyltransferase family 2 protein [Fermentimonas sp.]